MAAQLALLLLGASLSCAGVTGVEAKWVSKSGHPTTSTTSPAHSYSTFSYASMTSNRYATPLKSPLSFPTPFAPPLSEVSSLLGSNIVYTTYSLNPEATTIGDGPYGQSAYAALWESANLSYADSPPFTTTVTPTSIPRSELVFPPAFPVVPTGENVTANAVLPSDFVWGVASSAWKLRVDLSLKDAGRPLKMALGPCLPRPTTPTSTLCSIICTGRTLSDWLPLAFRTCASQFPGPAWFPSVSRALPSTSRHSTTMTTSSTRLSRTA